MQLKVSISMFDQFSHSNHAKLLHLKKSTRFFLRIHKIIENHIVTKTNPGILGEHKSYIKIMLKSHGVENILARMKMSDENRLLT